MLELLRLTGEERVLDVGTGSGYHAALLSGLAARGAHDRADPGAERGAAQATLADLGYTNVTCVVADGCDGVPDAAPFDAINVAAATGPSVPASLLDQLAIGGRLVAPVGDEQQYLTRFVRTEHGVEQETLEAVRFVPLVRADRH